MRLKTYGLLKLNSSIPTGRHIEFFILAENVNAYPSKQHDDKDRHFSGVTGSVQNAAGKSCAPLLLIKLEMDGIK